MPSRPNEKLDQHGSVIQVGPFQHSQGHWDTGPKAPDGYITQSANQGGFTVSRVFWRLFWKKIRFLSDQEVPGRHKNIYRELRRFFIRSEIFGNMCCFFRQQTQHLLPSLGTGSPNGTLWELVGKVIFSLFDPKNRFSAFNGPINIAGGRLDIFFHFANDWYNNIEG